MLIKYFLILCKVKSLKLCVNKVLYLGLFDERWKILILFKLKVI